MRRIRFWGSFFGILAGSCAAMWAQDPSFELQFSGPSRVNAVKAWGDQVCVIYFDDFRLRCLDRDGVLKFDVDIRERMSGGFNQFARIVDFTMLDDGGAAILGFSLDPEAPQPEEEFFPYVLQLDAKGEAKRFFPFRGSRLDPKALGGSRADNLVILGLSPEFDASHDPAPMQSSHRSRRSTGSLLHPLSPAGDILADRFSWEIPSSLDEMNELDGALSKGVAIDGRGNAFFWLNDHAVMTANARGERRAIPLSRKPGPLQLALRLIPRRDSGVLALVLEGQNQTDPDGEAAGFFVLSAPDLHVYALDPTGRVEELPSSGVTDIAGELDDGTLVGLKGTGRGRFGVVFLDPVGNGRNNASR